MATNRISATLSQGDRDAVMPAIATMRSKLPFLLDLSPEERKAMPKLGYKSRAFVGKALELATQNPGFLPRDFSVEEMRKDATLAEDLFAIRQAMLTLTEMVDDTYVAAGSESYVAALLVYNYAKSSNVGTEGLDGVVDELGARFARRAKPTPKPNT
jgi:hypothetical protein